MIARRLLLAAGGSGSFTPGAARVFTVTSPPDGAWPSATQAFYHGGSSYFGFCDNTGLIRAGSFAHADGAVDLVTLGGPTTVDQHNCPSLLRRSSDGRFVSVYCAHSSPNIYRRISTNADDITAWDAEANIDSSLGGTAYTYPALFELGDESGKLYLFYRDEDGVSNWEISTSTDGGSTWSALTNLTYGTRYYGRCAKTSESRLDFAFTSGSYAEDYADVYHMYYEGGSYYQTDGTLIAGSPPFAITDMTLIYDGSTAGARFPASIVKSGTDIAITFPVHKGTDEDYKYVRWNGSSWTVRTPAAAIGGLTLEFTEGGLVIDPANINRLALSRRATSDLDDPFRMYLYTTSDAGATWTDTALTSSGDPDMYPWFVEGHQPEFQFIWLKGTFTDFETFATGIEGWGAPI